jgi:hypothetical protein
MTTMRHRWSPQKFSTTSAPLGKPMSVSGAEQRSTTEPLTRSML